jgi:hypothetical protein
VKKGRREKVKKVKKGKRREGEEKKEEKLIGSCSFVRSYYFERRSSVVSFWHVKHKVTSLLLLHFPSKLKTIR